MSDQHHYVSQFHLRGFTDPLAPEQQAPWLWVGDCATRAIVRRAPKNVGWAKGLFGGPGGLAKRELTLERYLSQEVESPAAFGLRSLVSRPQEKRSPIPAEVGRYLAWAAARSVSMRALYQEWIDNTPALDEAQLVEDPPPGFEQMGANNRPHCMEHPTLGTRDDVPSDSVEQLRGQGWRLLLRDDDFLELVHLQAWYFQVRIFPSLNWVILEAPPGWNFIIGDRPLVWDVDGRFDVPPAAHRHGRFRVYATLTRSIALFAYHSSHAPPRAISTADVNRAMASGAKNWIAGPTRDVVATSLAERVREA